LLKIQQRGGDWVFVTPIGNLFLTPEIGREVRVERVLFVHRDKLPRIRKRLGLPMTIGQMRESPPGSLFSEFFTSADTFAVVRQRGKLREIEPICYRMVGDAISILALSQLGYARRRYANRIALFGEHIAGKTQRAFLNTRDAFSSFGGRLTSSPGPFALTGHWRNFHRQAFFLGLLKIINGDTKVSRSWRNDLKRAAIFAGRSINSNDVANSFLWNMIALELLLTQQGDKYSAALPTRIEAFLGWVGFWSSGSYEDRIWEIYQKRSALVHDGNLEDISKKDLLFTDDLLFNLLVNIVRFPKLFQSKGDVIDFAEKVEAEHRLGLKSKVRPKKLVYFSHRYTKEDLDEI